MDCTKPSSENLPGERREAILNEQDRQFLEGICTRCWTNADDGHSALPRWQREMLMSYSNLYAEVRVVDGTNTAELSYHLSHEHVCNCCGRANTL